MAYYASDYGSAVRNRLESLLGSEWPVFHLFNRKKEDHSKFIVYSVRDVGTEVFAGSKTNHGIDSPTIQLSFFANDPDDNDAAFKKVSDFFHGYTGQLASNTSGLGVSISAKCSVKHLMSTYDEAESVFQLVAEIDLFVVTPL